MCEVQQNLEFEAVWDNTTPTREGELLFKVGDIIRLIETIDDESDWAKGELNDQVGIFRLSFVVKREATGVSSKSDTAGDQHLVATPEHKASTTDAGKPVLLEESGASPTISTKTAVVDDAAVVQRRAVKGPPPAVRPKTAIFPPVTAPKPAGSRAQPLSPDGGNTESVRNYTPTQPEKSIPVEKPVVDKPAAEKSVVTEPVGSKKPPPRPSAPPNRALSKSVISPEEEDSSAKRDVQVDKAKIASALARGPPGGVAVLPFGLPRNLNKADTHAGTTGSSADGTSARNEEIVQPDDANVQGGEWPLNNLTKQRVKQAKKARPTSESLHGLLAHVSSAPLSSDSRDNADAEPVVRMRQPQNVHTDRQSPSQNGPEPHFAANRPESGNLQNSFALLLKRVEELERELAAERDERKRLQDDVDWIRRMLERK